MAEGKRLGLLAAIIVVAVVVLSSQLVMFRGLVPSARRVPYAEGLVPNVTPSTFRVEVRKSFRLAATGDFDPDCGRVSATVPELGYAQTFTRKELFDGVTSELNPAKTGVFHMAFSCRDREIGSAPLTVVIGPTSLPKKPSRWVLSAGKAIYQEKSFFQLPVTVRAEQLVSGAWLPFPVAQDAHFLLRDGKGELRQPPDLTIDRDTAISIPVWIDLPIRAEYALIANKKGGGQPTNEVNVSWQEHGPKLRLVSFPEELTIYDAPISHGSSEVYLANGGYRVRPPETLDVLVASPGDVVSYPADKLELTPQAPVALYQASVGSAAASAATVGFREPTTGATATLQVHILSPLRFLLTASGAALLGLLVARGLAIFTQKRWAIAVEFVSAIAAGCLLYSAELQKWLPLVGTPDFTLSYLAAGTIGVVGGFLGLGVFEGLAALFSLKLT